MAISQGSTNELPDLAAARDALRASLWQQPHLPADVLELCRLRLAQLHRSASDEERAEHELDEERRAAVHHWDTSLAIGDSERACLAFTEVYAMDAAALSDAHAAAVKAHFGDAGLVALIEALGVFDGAIRVNLLWGDVHAR